MSILGWREELGEKELLKYSSGELPSGEWAHCVHQTSAGGRVSGSVRKAKCRETPWSSESLPRRIRLLEMQEKFSSKHSVLSWPGAVGLVLILCLLPRQLRNVPAKLTFNRNDDPSLSRA